tara:strand:- start:8183 stop:8812 length:630 start_codon:yes stop_codon:yes gene_type:complete
MKCNYINNLNKNCKNNSFINILNINYCYSHYKLFLKNYIIKIQKVYRGYKSRKILYFYKKLPLEIQYKINLYIQNEFQLERKNKIISNIIINKIDNFIINYYNFNSEIIFLHNYIQNVNINFITVNNEHIINILLYLFYLLDKYRYIIITNKQFYINKYRNKILRVNMYNKLLELNNLLVYNKKNLVQYQNYIYINNVINYKVFYNNLP